MKQSDPILLAKEKGITSQIYPDIDQIAASLRYDLAHEAPLSLIVEDRRLPCYIIKIEELFTPVCYDPPASRHLLLAYNKQSNEWLLVGANWFAGINDMVLPSHLFIDELEMIAKVIKQVSAQAEVRVYSLLEVLPINRGQRAENGGEYL